MGITLTDDLTKKAIPLEDVAASVEVFTLFNTEFVFFFSDKDAAKKALEEGKINATEGTPVSVVQDLLNAVLPGKAPATENDSTWLIRQYSREVLMEAAEAIGMKAADVTKIKTTPRLKNDTARDLRKYMTENKIPADK